MRKYITVLIVFSVLLFMFSNQSTFAHTVSQDGTLESTYMPEYGDYYI